MVYNIGMGTKGMLIVNTFLDSPQVNDTYDLLSLGAKRHNIELSMHTNAEFFVDLESGIVANSDILPSPDDLDFILFWNKDVFLGRALSRMGYRLYNSADAIEYCDNKALTYEKLDGMVRMPRTLKIPMTFDTVGYTSLSFENHIAKILGYPYIIKECYGSYGGQVYLANDSKSARDILKKIEGRECLAQEFIKESRGRDLRAYVVGDKVVAAMERSNPDDFRSNITGGGGGIAFDITKEQEQMAVTAAKKLGLDFAGVDILFGKSGPVLCEVNSNAQFRGLLTATGVDITDALFEHIRCTCHDHHK